MGSNRFEGKGYISLKDFRVELKDSVKQANGAFSFCFWLYLKNFGPSGTCPILYQELPHKTSSLPFLALNEKKKLMLFPLFFLCEEALFPATSDHCVSVGADFPMNTWVHVGCQVSQKSLLLHLNGMIAGENSSPSSDQNGLILDGAKTVLPDIIGGSDGFQGFIYGAEVLPPTLSLQFHYVKDPPLQLSIDSPSTSEIEEENDGIWSVVGGKASCRRNFSLDVVLLDAFGQLVNSELEVIASLLYDDTFTSVENNDDAEAPLLITLDGIEYASSDISIKLVRGRASFKLKISQLSSKSDNRRFCIKFEIPHFGRYPFLEVFSRPIHCISRSRNVRTSSVACKQPLSGVNRSPEFPHNVVCEAKQSPTSKRVKLGQENPVAMFNGAFLCKPNDEHFSSHARSTTEANNATETNMARRPENHDQSDNCCSSGSDNGEATNPIINTSPSIRLQVSDRVVFNYCLGSLPERSSLLKELVISVREEELAKLADQVVLFSGCSHHRLPIMISKRLLEEGAKVWNSISLHNLRVPWENLASVIKDHFMKMVPHSTRSLTYQDLQLLGRIYGCQELVSKEKFEQIWCWLYPVAFTLSQDWMAGMWASMGPKWIEGFITKEEAESSLLGGQEPGTFILRFPTTRSWPHPDAGSLVVTYVGKDQAIRHKLLSFDFLHSSNSSRLKSLQQMLLEEPELSRLGRVARNR